MDIWTNEILQKLSIFRSPLYFENIISKLKLIFGYFETQDVW